MKSKTQFSLFCMLLLTLVWSACTTGGASHSGNGEKIQLEVKVEPGMVYKQVTKTVQNSEQKMMGMSTKTSQVTEMFIKNEVLSVDAEGTAEIRATYERIRSEMDNSMKGKTKFDSDNAPEDLPMENRSHMAMVGRSIVFKLNKRGSVTDVSGVDSLFDAILGSIGAGENEIGMATMKKTLKMTFGDEGIKSMMQSAAIQYPDVLIAEGDTWGKEIGTLANIPIGIDVTYTVDHIDAEKVVLKYDGKISTDKSKAMDLGIIQMEMDLAGDYSGTTELDRKTGLVIKSDVDQDMKGSMSTLGMNLPMTITQKVTVARY